MNSIKNEVQYSAEGFLEDGVRVLAERGKQYDPAGKAARSMAKIIKAFNCICGRDLTEAEGWEFMALVKQVRLFQRPGFHADSAQDAVNYAALCGEAKAKEKDAMNIEQYRDAKITKAMDVCASHIGIDSMAAAAMTAPLGCGMEYTRGVNTPSYMQPPKPAKGSYMDQKAKEEARNLRHFSAYNLYLSNQSTLELPGQDWKSMEEKDKIFWLDELSRKEEQERVSKSDELYPD